MSLWDDIGSFISGAAKDTVGAVKDVADAVTGSPQPTQQAPPQPQRLQINQPQQVQGIFSPQQQNNQDQQAAMADAAAQTFQNNNKSKLQLTGQPYSGQNLLNDIKNLPGEVAKTGYNYAVKPAVNSGKFFINTDIINPAKSLVAQTTGNKQAEQNAYNAQSQELGTNPKQALERVGSNVLNLASYIAPGGEVLGKGADPLLKVATGAGIYGSLGAGQAALQGGNTKQILQGAAQMGAMGAGGEALHLGGRKAAQIIKENPLNEAGAVGKNVRWQGFNPPESKPFKPIGAKASGGFDPQELDKLSKTLTAGQKAELSPKQQQALFEREHPTQVNNQLPKGAIERMDKENPIKVPVLKQALDSINPNDPNRFEHARAVTEIAPDAVKVATRIAAYSAKRAGLTVEQLADMIEHPQDHPELAVRGNAKLTKIQQAVQDFRNLTDRVSASSHALGGKEPRMNNFVHHAIDTSDWENEGNGPVFDTKTGQVADPKDFRGVNAISRKVENGKIKYPDLRSLHKAGMTLRDEDNVERFINNYGRAAANKLEKQSLIEAFSRADGGAESHLHSLDLGTGKPLMLSDEGLKAVKAYSRLHEGTFGKIFDAGNSGLKHGLLSVSQYHPTNINYLTVVPHLALQGHPLRALRVAAETPLSALSKVHANNLARKDLESGLVEKSSLIGSPLYKTDFTPSGEAPKLGQMVFGREVPVAQRQENAMAIKTLERKNIDLNSQAARERGQTANNASGFTNAKLHNVNPNATKWLSRPFLAPQFEGSKVSLIKNIFDPTTTALNRRSALAAVAGKYGMETAIALGIGAAVHQTANSLTDTLKQELFSPAVSTNQQENPKYKGDTTNTLKYKQPSSPISELLSLFGHTTRQPNGRLSITWNKPSDVVAAIEEDARNKLSPIAGMITKIKTNSTYANKPLYDPAAPLGVKVEQAVTALVTDQLPIGLQGVPYTKVVKEHLPGNVQNILNANQPGTNPLLKSAFSTIGLTPETDTTVGKGLQSTQYYNALGNAQKGLNTQELAALNLNTASKKNPVTGQYDVNPSVWDGPARASVLLENPKALTALINMNKSLAQQGQKVDPLYLQSPQRIQSYLQYAAIADKPDAQSSNWLANNPWYDQGDNSVLAQRNAFYASLPPGDPNKPLAPIEYPTPNAQTTADMNTWSNMLQSDSGAAEQYLLNHSDVQTQLDNQAAYDNQVLVARGYGALRTYPTPPASVAAKLNSLPQGNTSAAKKARAAIYNQSDVANWMQQDAVYNLTKGAALAQIQGNSPSSKTLGAVNDLSYDLVKNPDGTYALKYNDNQGGTGGGGSSTQSGAVATGAGASSSSSSSPMYYKRDIETPHNLQIKTVKGKHVQYKLATNYNKIGKIRAKLPNPQPLTIGKPGQI